MTTRNWTREIDDDYAGREEKQERIAVCVREGT